MAETPPRHPAQRPLLVHTSSARGPSSVDSLWCGWPAQLRFVFLPWGSFRGFWDLLTLCFVLYTAIQMPYELAFVDDTETDWSVLRVIDLLQDFIFLFDIAINFNTAYVRADATLVITKRAITVRHYPA